MPYVGLKVAIATATPASHGSHAGERQRQRGERDRERDGAEVVDELGRAVWQARQGRVEEQQQGRVERRGLTGRVALEIARAVVGIIAGEKRGRGIVDDVAKVLHRILRSMRRPGHVQVSPDAHGHDRDRGGEAQGCKQRLPSHRHRLDLIQWHWRAAARVAARRLLRDLIVVASVRLDTEDQHAASWINRSNWYLTRRAGFIL